MIAIVFNIIEFTIYIFPVIKNTVWFLNITIGTIGAREKLVFKKKRIYIIFRILEEIKT